METARRFARFAWGVLAYNVLVVLWGGYVRATGSGAGCGNHWPLCNGEVLPRAPRVETVIEFTHRAMSGLALVSVALLLIWAFRQFPRGHRVRRAAVWSSVFLVVEALLGAGLVLLQLVEHNASAGRSVYLSAHLANTLLLLGALVCTAWLAGGASERVPIPRASLGALAVGMVLGVTGALAALGDTLFPAASLATGLRDEFTSGSPALLRLRLLHPAVAVLGGAWLLWVALAAARSGRASRAAWPLITLILVQMIVGALNVALLAPVWMQMVHLLLADLVWIALVAMCLETAHKPLPQRRLFA